MRTPPLPPPNAPQPAPARRCTLFRRTRAVLRREIGRIRCRPIYAALLAGLPLGSFLLFVFLFGPGTIDSLPVALVDEDRTPLSRRLAAMIEAAPAVRIACEAASADEARRLLLAGRVAAIVQIPASFESDLLGGTPTEVVCSVTGTNLSVNGMLSKDLQAAVSTFSGGVALQRLTARGADERQAMAVVQPVRFDKHVLFNPTVNYGLYLMPGFLPMMLLLFVVLATLYTIGIELKEGTAIDWFATAEGHTGAALAGKLLPVTAAMCLLAGVMFGLLLGVTGVPCNGSFALLAAATLLLILAYQSIAVMLVALTADLRLSLSLGGGYAVLAFSFSGLTFPLLGMWRSARIMSLVFPFTCYMRIVIDQLLRGAPVRCSLPDAGWLLLFALVPLATLKRLKRVATDPKYIGRE